MKLNFNQLNDKNSIQTDEFQKCQIDDIYQS